MQVGQFPASAASSLIEGYCDDFVSLAAMLAQTLEQVAMRGINFDTSRESLQRIEHGMSELAAAIRELLERGSVSNVDTVLGRKKVDDETAGPAPGPTPIRAPASPAVGRRPGGPGPGPTQTAMSPRTPTPGPGAPRPTAAAEPPAQRSIGAASPTRTARPAQHAAGGAAGGAPVLASAAVPRAARAETLKGTNRSMPLLSVFQFLGRMRKSGTVHVYIETETLAFEFVNGCIEFTASDRCPVGERLGELLVELGSCSREALAPILAKVGVSSAHRLGHLVVEARLVSNGQVLEALESQVRRRFQRVCSSPEAAYEFDEGRRLPGDGRIRIAPLELSFEPGRGGH
jgi:hypothetical protein